MGWVRVFRSLFLCPVSLLQTWFLKSVFESSLVSLTTVWISCRFFRCLMTQKGRTITNNAWKSSRTWWTSAIVRITASKCGPVAAFLPAIRKPKVDSHRQHLLSFTAYSYVGMHSPWTRWWNERSNLWLVESALYCYGTSILRFWGAWRWQFFVVLS